MNAFQNVKYKMLWSTISTIGRSHWLKGEIVETMSNFNFDHTSGGVMCLFLSLSEVSSFSFSLFYSVFSLNTVW